MEQNNYYAEGIEDTLNKLNSNASGLTDKEANKRLKELGKNILESKKKDSLLKRFFHELTDTMILVLIAAAFVSAGVNIWEGNYLELFESGLILLIVIINAVISLVQQNKAEEVLESLKRLNKPEVQVRRDSKILNIGVEDVVVGDIVIIDAGDIIPADLRLINSSSLQIEEANLTGESIPSKKNHDAIMEENTPLGDRQNMAYSSCVVSYGRGEGVVVAIGMDTEVGKIAGMLNTSKKVKTPLQEQLAKTAKYLSYIVLVIAVIIFIASLINVSDGNSVGEDIVSSFMVAVAIAVAAIPEGLPAVVTIVLALNVKKMSARKAIVRHLPAVETLGSCQVICSDKTGTITLNEMTVKKLFTLSKGLYYESTIDKKDKSVLEAINIMTLCNDTSFGEKNKLLGDPTETALTAYSKHIGIDVKELINKSTRTSEIPFDSVRKLMTTINEVGNKKIAYTKGAFDILLSKCSHILDGDEIRELTKDDISKLNNANKEMASSALRILGLAYKDKDLEKKDLEKNMIFVGLVGMIDPPREEVPSAIETCKKAGIRVIMITGDHLATATAIAKQVGIYEEGNKAITGAELDKMSQKDFKNEVLNISVYARVSPENKVRIVNTLRSLKLVVAMTGDGVNDAPAIKIADIGVGMGITGTDVSKGVADIVLADDNFATIVSAVEEGRKAYNNIVKAVQYLLSANIAEVLCLFIATIFLKVEFLTAIMILWINLVTDSLPALALGTEKAEKDIMDYPPRKNSKSLFAGQTGKDIILQGVMQTILTMTSFVIGAYVLSSGIENHYESVTMAFITLSMIQLFHSYNLRSQRKSLLGSNPFTNKYLNGASLIGLVLISVVIFVPGIREIFNTVALSRQEYLIAIGCAFLIIPLVEIQKLIENKLINK